MENMKLKEENEHLEKENREMLRLLDQMRRFFQDAENLRNATKSYHFR